MEKKIFRQFKKRRLVDNTIIILALMVGVFLAWKSYSETGVFSWSSITLVIVVLLVSCLFGNSYHLSGVRCPQCKSRIYPQYEQMENDKKTWVQIQFPCEKCNIL